VVQLFKQYKKKVKLTLKFFAFLYMARVRILESRRLKSVYCALWPGIIRLQCYNACTPTAIQCTAKIIYSPQRFNVSLQSTFRFSYKTIPHPSFSLFVTSSYLTSFLLSFIHSFIHSLTHSLIHSR
jgi:hypothetical protein